jgi:hypothetical protein
LRVCGGLLPVFRYTIVIIAALAMWEYPQGFPRGVRRVESRLVNIPSEQVRAK